MTNISTTCITEAGQCVHSGVARSKFHISVADVGNCYATSFSSDIERNGVESSSSPTRFTGTIICKGGAEGRLSSTLGSTSYHAPFGDVETEGGEESHKEKVCKTDTSRRRCGRSEASFSYQSSLPYQKGVLSDTRSAFGMSSNNGPNHSQQILLGFPGFGLTLQLLPHFLPTTQCRCRVQPPWGRVYSFSHFDRLLTYARKYNDENLPSFCEVGCAADTRGVPEVTQDYLKQPAKIVNPPLATNRIGDRSRRLPLLVKNEKVLKTMYTHEQSEQNILWAILLTWSKVTSVYRYHIVLT